VIPWLGFTTVQTDLCCFSCSLLLSLLLVVVVVVGLLRCCFDLSVACVRQAYCSLLPAMLPSSCRSEEKRRKTTTRRKETSEVQK
jgi:hypothetical protein